MALITDKKTSKKLENRLTEFSKFGMTLYYLLEEGRVNIKDLEKIFFSSDDDKSSLVYSRLIKNVNPVDLKVSFNKYRADYSSFDEDENDLKDTLNILYTKKIINEIVSATTKQIDKTYVNTYDYLLMNSSND